MLPNYDAKAVAEVMGLAFVQGSKHASAPASRFKADADKERLGSVSTGAIGDFVIRIDEAAMFIVEIKKDGLAAFATSRTSGGRASQIHGRRVTSPTSVLIEKAVEGGLPREALRHVAEMIAGGDKAKASALEWGVVPKTTLERRETRLSPQESERTERIARLFVHARRALGTDAEAREFMTSPHPELDGRSPMDAAKTDLGTRRTEHLLNALEYGLAV